MLIYPQLGLKTKLMQSMTRKESMSPIAFCNWLKMLRSIFNGLQIWFTEPVSRVRMPGVVLIATSGLISNTVEGPTFLQGSTRCWIISFLTTPAWSNLKEFLLKHLIGLFNLLYSRFPKNIVTGKQQSDVAQLKTNVMVRLTTLCLTMKQRANTQFQSKFPGSQ